MATQPRRLRADDLPHIPVDDPATGYELVDGELVPVMGANPRHAELILEIGSMLRSHVRATNAGRVFADAWVRLPLPHDTERVRAPDIAFFSTRKLADSGGVPGDYFRVVPDLVIEIYSPGNERKGGDFHQRVRDYLDAGVPLLWVLYPASGYATVFRADGSAQVRREHETLDGEAVVPGFEVILGDLLPRSE